MTGWAESSVGEILMNGREFELKYGHTVIETIANRGSEIAILDARSPEPAGSADEIIKVALREPIDSPPLSEVVSPGDKVAIVASDTTRQTLSHLFLPIIVEELNSLGIPDSDIDIIIALGIHRRQTREEHRSLLGDKLYERIRPVDHDAHDRDNLISYGRTSRGTEVAVNRTVAEADKIILTGAVSPHYFAGFGGGRKSIMPGVCSMEANLQSHILVFNPSPAGGRNDDVGIARLAGNPVHEDMLEAARMVNPHFILNTVVTPEKELAAAFTGNMASAHAAACNYYLKHFGVVAEKPADLTIVSCGGYPKDINFIQAHKAIHNAYSVTRPGGWMIVLAKCADGFGDAGFIDWFRFDDAAQFEKALLADYHMYGQTAYATFEKSTTVNITFVSDIDASNVERMKMRPASSFEEAYKMAVESLPENFTTYVIPAASSTLLLTEDGMARAVASI